MSYTAFALVDLHVVHKSENVCLEFAVTNTGSRPGSTVAQVYIGDNEASIPRPVRELKAFRKVALDPGEATNVQIDLPMRAFAFFDVASRCWCVEEGGFTISVGFSATDLVASAELHLKASTVSV